MAEVYTIRVHAIPLSDRNGGRATTVSRDAFAGALNEVNRIFAPVDLRFAFNPDRDWRPLRNTALNSLHNGGSSWWSEANRVAARQRGKLVVFLRWGKDQDQPAGNWFAYPPNTGQRIPPNAPLPADNVDFIAITNQASRFGARAAVVLAHEIGHYLGLFHTHPTWGNAGDDLVERLVREKGASGLDGDLLSDTPPDPGRAYYKRNVSDQACAGPAGFQIGSTNFRPDRQNLMSYYQECQPPVTISRQQVSVMRQTIFHPTRFHLVAASRGTRYLGVFRAGTGSHALWVGDTWDGFHEKWRELSNQGLRLIDLETYVMGGRRRYAGVFTAGTDAHALWVGNNWEGFRDKWQELSRRGLRLIDLETYVEGGTRRFAGVFRAGTDAHALWVGDDWDGFRAKWQELSDRGLRLIDFETYLDGRTRRYAGVFRAGRDAHALWVGDTWEGFRSKWEELSANGLRLIDLETYTVGRSRRYVGVFRAGRDAHALWVNDDWDGFRAKWEELSANGLRLVNIEVFGSNVSEDSRAPVRTPVRRPELVI